MEYPYGIINGNSDEVLDELLARGERYDLVLTDPPYNINKDFGNDSDRLPLEYFLTLTEKRVSKLRELLTPEGALVWFGIHDYIGFIQVIMYKAGLYYRRMNIWHYENGFAGYTKMPAAFYEPLLWCSKGEEYTYHVIREPYKSQERLKHKVTKKDGTAWVPNPEGRIAGDVWDFPVLAGRRVANEKVDHPTQKPLSISNRIVKHFSKMNIVPTFSCVMLKKEILNDIDFNSRQNYARLLTNVVKCILPKINILNELSVILLPLLGCVVQSCYTSACVVDSFLPSPSAGNLWLFCYSHSLRLSPLRNRILSPRSPVFSRRGHMRFPSCV